MDRNGFVCVMLRGEKSATREQVLAVAEEVFDLPPEHAAALAQGALDGEETMVACLPPRPARALLAAAEEWSAARGAALSFRLSTVADAFSGLPPGEQARRGYLVPRARSFAAWQRSFLPSLLGIGLLLAADAWLVWSRWDTLIAILALLAVALLAGAICGWLWLQRRTDHRHPLPLAGFWLMLLAPLALFFVLADQDMLSGSLGIALADAGLVLIAMGAFLLLITGSD